eukprot:COSAG04_NODE_30088_length_264_cov_114.721212_1_plen_37_part_10
MRVFYWLVVHEARGHLGRNARRRRGGARDRAAAAPPG